MIPLVKELDVDEINTALIAIRKLLNNVGITETNITNIVGKDYDAKIQELEEKVEADDVYSTTEVKTNKKWIDEKPIYRKVIQVNARAIAGTNLPTGLPSGSEIINMWVRAQWGTNEGWNNDYTVNNIQYIYPAAITTAVFSISNDGTSLISNSASGRYVKDVILEYTKPTT